MKTASQLFVSLLPAVDFVFVYEDEDEAEKLKYERLFCFACVTSLRRDYALKLWRRSNYSHIPWHSLATPDVLSLHSELKVFTLEDSQAPREGDSIYELIHILACLIIRDIY